MSLLPKYIRALTVQLSKLPGIGPKVAARLAFYLAGKDADVDPSILGRTLLALRKSITICAVCHNIAEKSPCDICAAANRDKSTICVVEEPLDLLAIEGSRSYKGLYHVLGGRISPTGGVKPSDLTIQSLINRVKKDKRIKEIILATNPNMEGDLTANFLFKVLAPLRVKITRLGRGLSVGSSLEYTDEVTLARAFEGRREIKG